MIRLRTKKERIAFYEVNQALFLTLLTLAVFAAGAWAQTSDSTAPARKKMHKPEAAAPAEPAVTAADVQALKDALAAQQQQIQQLSQQLQQTSKTAAGAGRRGRRGQPRGCSFRPARRAANCECAPERSSRSQDA